MKQGESYNYQILRSPGVALGSEIVAVVKVGEQQN